MNKLYIKKLGILFLISLMIINAFGCTKKKEGIVAEVNGIEITEEEFNDEFQLFSNDYERQYGKGSLQEIGPDGKTLEELIKNNVVEKLIMEKLVEKEMDASNIVVTDEDIKAGLDEYANQIGGQEKLDEFLDANNISKEFYDKFLIKRVAVKKHREYVMNNTNISDEEANEFFEKYKDDLVLVRVSHIIVGSEDEGKKILERLKNGEDFETIAKLESQHNVSAVKGGDLGYVSKGQLGSASEEFAFSLEIGEISDLIKTEEGYYRIIRVDDKKDTYEDLKDEINDILKEQEYIKIIQELRNNAKVKYYIDSNN